MESPTPRQIYSEMMNVTLEIRQRTLRLFGKQPQLKRIEEYRSRQDLLNPDVSPFIAYNTFVLTEFDWMPVQDLKPGKKIFSPDARTFIRVEDILRPDEFVYPTLVSNQFKVGANGRECDLFVSQGCKVEVRSKFSRPYQSVISVRKWRLLEKYSTRKCESTMFYSIVLKGAQSICANGAKVSSVSFDDLYG